MQYVYESAHTLAKLIREGHATSVDVVKEHVARIKERNRELNALVVLFEPEALSVAAERDRQAREGRFLGPLHGVPVTVKEQFWIRGQRSKMIYSDYAWPFVVAFNASGHPALTCRLALAKRDYPWVSRSSARTGASPRCSPLPRKRPS